MWFGNIKRTFNLVKGSQTTAIHGSQEPTERLIGDSDNLKLLIIIN
jgi:hypothetical protein